MTFPHNVILNRIHWFILRRNFLDHHWERTVSFFETHPIKENDIVFLGDSLIEAGHWAEVFTTTTRAVRNRGINGDTTEHILKRLAEIVKGRPQKVFILVGTNDLWLGTDISKILGNYQEIISSLKEKSATTKIYIMSVLPRNARFASIIQKFNSQLHTLSNKFAVEYLDLYPYFLDTSGHLNPQYSNDELHLNGLGYLKLQQLINNYL